MISIGIIVLVMVAVIASPVFAAGTVEKTAVRDTLTIAIGAEPESLDPVKMTSAPAATVGEHVIERLIYMEEDGSLVPMLATSWSANADSTVWTFQIREGVTFHDGEPLNAEAVRLNLARFVDPEVGAAYAFLLGSVREINATGEYTLELRLAQPFAPILSHLSHSFIGIVSPRQIRGIAPTATFENPVGTGPYTMDRWSRGDSIRLSLNENYWGDTPQIPNLVFNFIPEESARIVALETGEADAIMAVPPQDVARLEADPNIDVVFQTSVRTIYIGFNNLREPFTDPAVRRALNHAIDKQAIVDSIFEGSGFVADAPIVDAVFGHTSVGPYAYDPALARRMLAEAGFPDGFSMTLHHPTGRYPLDATVAAAVQSMLADVGVDARLETREWSSYLQFTSQPPDQAQYDAFMLGWGTVTLDADYGLFALLHSAQWNPNGNNRGFYKNERVDEILSAARVETSPDRRRTMYHEAIGLIWDDAPWIYLYNAAQINAVRTNVGGLIHHPLENLSAWDAFFR
ncbi:MAG: glutathione ABC transporter substrate-binding protein [Spirochaetaceae bacterium]|nr:MAG: glutathione ABC transporter substrate-binding protein [Spirochaetaceae bacterium]